MNLSDLLVLIVPCSLLPSSTRNLSCGLGAWLWWDL